MSRKTVAFDLETIADHELLKTLPPPEVKLGNTKDEEKIKAKMAEAEEKRLANMGLNRFENMICVFGWCDGMESGHTLLEAGTGEAEKSLLTQAWEILNGYDHFVSFNGMGFDVPVLNLHSMFRGIRPAVNISCKKYQITNHTDLRMVFGNWDSNAPGKLDFFLRRCLGHGKAEGIDGSMVQHYWDCGMAEVIGQYGQQDAEDTYTLYQYARQFYPGLS